jgi:tryptophan synthase beta chain
LFGLSGHGHFDLGSYESYLNGKLQDYEYPGREIETA